MSTSVLNSGFLLYDALISPLRQTDRETGNNLIKRFLGWNPETNTWDGGPQASRELTEAEILELLVQVLPHKVRSELVKFLKDIVGFTADLNHITDRLTEQQLRRLIQLAIPLWKQRHTSLGLLNTIRLLTGRDATYTDWFGFRWLLAETEIGEEQLVSGGDSWIIGGSTSLYDEFWSNLRLMDDGTLDELLLLDIVKLHRPMSERVEVFLADFLDNFDRDLGLWTRIAGTDDPTLTDGEMTIPAGTEVQPAVPILGGDPAAHQDYVLIHKFKLQSGSTHRVKWYVKDSTHYYQVDIKLTTDKVTVTRFNPGPGILGTSDVPTVGLAPDTYYKLRIQTVNISPTTRRWKLYLDNVLVFDMFDFGPNPPYGPYTFSAVTGGDPTTIDNVESFRIPGRFATVQVSTLTERGGHVEMTPNFIL